MQNIKDLPHEVKSEIVSFLQGDNSVSNTMSNISHIMQVPIALENDLYNMCEKDHKELKKYYEKELL